MNNNSLAEIWKICRLGDVAQTEKGKKPKSVSKEKNERFNIPYVNIKAFEKNIIDEYTDGVGCVLCEDDDFLMVWDGSRSGHVGKAIKGALGSTLVRIKLPDVDHDYAFYFLQSKFQEINTRAKGVGIPHVDPNLLWNYQLPLPDRQTQHQIVSRIEELFSELDKSIEGLKTAQQQLKAYRQSVLQWAFEGRLGLNHDSYDLSDDHDFLHNGESHHANQINQENQGSDNLPEGWKWVKLGDICEIKRGKSKHRPRDDKKLYGGQYPFIQTGDVRAARGKMITQYSQTYSELGLQQSKLWPKGTLCLTIAANIAEIAFLTFDACFPDSIVGIVANSSQFSLKYINYFMQKSKKEIDNKASATAQKNINVDFLENLVIPVGSIIQQHEIIQEIETRLSVADKLEETISQSLQQAEALRQSILKQAFEGRLIYKK
ncbi:MAG TPA: restriction endonuclease subunit S [Flavipsychrobacter sp.]|nr:restriction endonuclease subunit S [Flavipsychrobacter sp.]